MDGNVYFSGSGAWKSGFLVPQLPGLARARFWAFLLCPHMPAGLSRNKGTNRGHEGLILMASSPHAPPPRTGPSPWGCRFHHVIPGMASPFSSLHFLDETPVFWGRLLHPAGGY